MSLDKGRENANSHSVAKTQIDGGVLSQNGHSRYSRAHPIPKDVLLLIEVADTTKQYDREIKVSLYARHHIPEVCFTAWVRSLATPQTNTQKKV